MNADEAPLDAPADEVARLRRCLSDIVRVMALPTQWAGGEPKQIISTLAGALLGILPLAFVFVRLNEVDGESSTDMMRVAEPLEATTRFREAGSMLNAAFEKRLGNGPPAHGSRWVTPISVSRPSNWASMATLALSSPGLKHLPSRSKRSSSFWMSPRTRPPSHCSRHAS